MCMLLLVLCGVGGGMTCSAGGDRGSNYSPSCGHLSLDQVSQVQAKALFPSQSFLSHISHFQGSNSPDLEYLKIINPEYPLKFPSSLQFLDYSN